MIAPADNDDVLPPGSFPLRISSSWMPAGVQGRRHVEPDHQPADIDRMETIDVLPVVDRLDDLLFVDVLRERKLDENAVDGRDRR